MKRTIGRCSVSDLIKTLTEIKDMYGDLVVYIETEPGKASSVTMVAAFEADTGEHGVMLDWRSEPH